SLALASVGSRISIAHDMGCLKMVAVFYVPPALANEAAESNGIGRTLEPWRGVRQHLGRHPY
ncbi:hypothetical protein PPI47_19845, partial [Burkholderia cenocepacia]|nr:hypothetical protein [Burkholderia cenocepacia]